LKKHLSLIIFFVFIFSGFFVFAPAPLWASGATYYVATSGSDTNSGTQSAPWATLQKALGSISSGDMVIIRGGIYRQPGSMIGYPYKSFGPAGTAGNLTTFKSYPGERVIITGPNNDLIQIAVADYVRIDSLWFGGDYVTGIKGPVFQISGVGKEIVNNTFFNWPSGPLMGWGENVLFQGNRLVNTGRDVHTAGTYFSSGYATDGKLSNHIIADHNIYIGNNISAGYGFQFWHGGKSMIATRNFVAGHSWGSAIDGDSQLWANNFYWKQTGKDSDIDTVINPYGPLSGGSNQKYINNIFGPSAWFYYANAWKATQAEIDTKLSNNAFTDDPSYLPGSGGPTCKKPCGVSPYVFHQGQESAEIGISAAALDKAVGTISQAFLNPLDTIYSDTTVESSFQQIRSAQVPTTSPLYRKGLPWFGQAIDIGWNVPAPASVCDYWAAFTKLGLKHYDKYGSVLPDYSCTSPTPPPPPPPPPPPSTVTGDVNGDGKVDFADLQALLLNILGTVTAQLDLIVDGKINSLDFAVSSGEIINANPPPPGDTQAPVTVITAPAGGQTVSGTFSVVASATDNVGVTKVEFYIDGAIKNTDTGVPYGFNLDTTQLTNAAHTVYSKAYDAAGNVGSSSSITFTVSNTAPPPQTMTLNLSSYFGGSGEDSARDVVTDSQGNAYVVGGLGSATIQTTQTFKKTGTCAVSWTGNGGKDMDAYVMKISPTNQLVWSTRIGGPCYDRSYGVELDSSGNIYLTGRAGPNFPTTSGTFQPGFYGFNSGSAYGEQNAFVAKVSPTGALVWASYVGSTDGNRDIAVDGSGDVYIGTGFNSATQKPLSGLAWFSSAISKAFQVVNNRGFEGLIVKIKSDGSQVVWASFYGGTGNEGATPSIRVDRNGYVYYLTNTTSTNLPVKNAFKSTLGGTIDMALVKFHFDSGVGKLVTDYSTYFGGSDVEFTETHGLAVDVSGNAYIAATTKSTNLTTTTGAYQRTYGGSGGSGNYPGDGFVAKFSPTGTLLSATYLGGSSGEGLEGTALDSSGNVFVSGATYSTNFPTSSGAFQTSNKGRADVFAAKLSPDLKSLLFSTYLGGTGDDLGRSATVDSAGNFLVVGLEYSSNLPTKSAFQITYGGAGDELISKFGP